MEFLGNSSRLSILSRSLEKGNFSQAYIFAGPEGVGKLTLAKAFASGVVSGKGLQFDQIQHIDIEILSPQVEKKRGISKEKDILIEDIRSALKNLSFYPQKGKKRVLIIDNAHKLTLSAQNALLKTLEEPNSSSILILVTHREGSILNTIKSRCHIVRFSLLSESELEERYGNEIALLAVGRPAFAEKLVNDKFEREKYDEIMEDISILENGSDLEKMRLAEKISKNKVEAGKLLSIWVWKIRKESFKDNEYQESFSKIEKVEKSSEILQLTNVNSRLLLENLFISL